MIRLNKFLAQSGIGSRRFVEKYIKSGEVVVNGAPVTSPSHLVDPERDRVVFRGNPVEMQAYTSYIILNKPRGYLTTAKDEHGRKTVFALVNTPARVFPVGRLDRDSEGLLLLTNDGELSNRLIHPRYKIPKQYLVYLNARFPKELVKKFRQGIVIDQKVRVTGELRFPNPADSRICTVTITQGKNRQIRKMFAALGFRVRTLQRLAIGPIRLNKLKLGSWRYLSDREVLSLKELVGLADGNQK